MATCSVTTGMLWHYTTGQLLPQILADGIIKPATIGVPKGEKPVVWFSSNQDWEQTANKMSVDFLFGRLTRLNKQQTHELGGGLVRIGIAPETAPLDWRAHKRLNGVTPKTAKGLYHAAVAVGARPGEWFVSPEPVPRALWLTIEKWDGTDWRSVEQA